MAQAKKKTATRTAKKPAAKKTCSKKKCGYKSVSGADRFHMYFILVLALVAGILLAANTAIFITTGAGVLTA